MIDPKVIAKLEAEAEAAAKKIKGVVHLADIAAFHAANGFHIAAIRCGESRVVAGEIQSPVQPMIVNYAFAIELYLKSLLIASNAAQRGHKLDELFAKLRVTDREDIEKNFEIINGRNAQLLADDLRSYARAFEEWRYLFESRRETRIAVYSLADLARACFLTISERNDGWANDSVKKTLSTAAEKAGVTVISLGGGVMVRGNLG
ncbi:hypothetical protein [Mesorhizobium sp. M0715]|uniref:hypothetical protein n=1 Tax=Mesorhizobium sp. M0715 TaxID=2956990 RepID=UPI0033386746